MKFLVVLILLFLAYKALRRNGYIKVYKHGFSKHRPQAKSEGTVTIEKLNQTKASDQDDYQYTDYEEVK